MKQFHRNPLSKAVSFALTGTVVAATVVLPAHAQEAESALEEVIVTATKRAESLQDIPLSVQVLNERALENLQIKGFEDYVVFMPTVSYTSAGPGYGEVFMRGIASGSIPVHSGSMPSVGVYLDEQPVTTIAQILDVHIYDIARIETLSGPQGTLFGQGSQAGTIRIITNKPLTGFYEAAYDVYANNTKSGDPGYGVDGMVNLPIGDNMAVRLVAWYKKTGGYIDNVPGRIDYATSGIVRTNDELVKSNFNEAEVSGLRALLKVDLNENWTLTPGIIYQTAEADGSWAHNPGYIGDLQTNRFFPDWQDEDWYQASLTLEGQLGDLDLVYAGAYLDRNVEAQTDYSGYSEYWEFWLDSYYNDYLGYNYYCLYYNAEGDCADPSQFISSDETFTRMSHEIRLQSDQDQRLRWIAGLFYQRQEHYFDLQWVVPDGDPDGNVIPGKPVVWQTNQKRVDRDEALFGEVYFDLSERFTLIGGLRWFEFENSLYGFNGRAAYCTGYFDESGAFVEDEDGELQYPCYQTGILDNVAKDDDIAWKGSVEWRLADNKMVYATYSEGFRAGGANRARIEGLEAYEPDWVYNYEVGWKTTWAGGRVRFNGALYLVDWDNFQFSWLDFSISPLTVIDNGPEARTKGIEWDLDYAATDSLTLSFAGSYNKAEMRDDFWTLDKDREAGDPPTAPKGTEMPRVPEIQLTAIGRWNFNIGDLPSFAQAALSYTDKSWNDLEVAERQQMDSYTVLNLAAGIEKEKWSLSFYVNNVTDERGQIDITDAGYPNYPPPGLDWTEYVIRPLSYGIRWSQRF